MLNLKNIETFLKSFDLFGESFSFKIKKRKYYTSLIGGITSFIFIIYSLYYLITNLTDFFSKNIRTSENEIKIPSENSVQLKEHQYFIFFFCFRNSQMKADSYLTKNIKIESFYFNNNLNNSIYNSTEHTINTIQCTKEEFHNTFSEEYNFNDFAQCQCLNTTSQENKQKDFELKSNKLYATKSFFKINFSNNIQNNLMINNNKENLINTGSNEDYSSLIDVDEYLLNSESKLYIHFPSYFTEAKNLQEPLRKSIQTEVYKLKSFNYLESNLDFSIINFKDYSSLYSDGKIISDTFKLKRNN